MYNIKSKIKNKSDGLYFSNHELLNDLFPKNYWCMVFVFQNPNNVKEKCV